MCRDWLSDEIMEKMNLNERQKKGIVYLRLQGNIINSGYQGTTGATRPTAKRDLEDLVANGIIERKGSGRSANYEFSKKWLKNGSNGPGKHGN